MQFTDDTIVFCPQSEDSIRNYRRILQCFEVMLGLSINFEKSSIIPLNCQAGWTRRMCDILGCSSSRLPIKYLGIPLGANPKRVNTWRPIVNRVEKKLSAWKMKILSKAGRLVLIKSMLNSLPLYYLSLFKMSREVAKKIISLQTKFFWGKTGGGSGVPLVSWEVIEKPKNAGGLGVGNLVIKNSTLLFKWWWRFPKEECLLWKKVVYSYNDIHMEQPLH